MCIVVDANAANNLHAEHDAGALVLAWLLKGKGKLVVSQDNLRELFKTRLRETIVTLDRASRLCRSDDEACNGLRDKLLASGKLHSNDAHVVALVTVSGCDLVYTRDKPLHQDLKNKDLVPKGCSVFQTADHKHLLGECNC
jgi:rRNA-processing protein FCF1